MRSSVAQNPYIDGRPYLKGILGLSLLPSAKAQQNKANYEADLDWIVKNINRSFVGSQLLQQIAWHSSRNVVIQPRPIPKSRFRRRFADQGRVFAFLQGDNDRGQREGCHGCR
jgi:hypothetical protein